MKSIYIHHTNFRLRPVLSALVFILAACTEQAEAPAASLSGDAAPDYGLSDRPVNAECVATNFRQPATIRLDPLTPRGTFHIPSAMAVMPDNDDRLYVLQQNGVVRRLERRGESYSIHEFVDLRDFTDVLYVSPKCYECGLFSMAFHPDFEDNGFIYLSFTEGGQKKPLMSYIARFRTDDGGLTLVENDDGVPVRENIYSVRQPGNGHNNGHIAFGPDGYLYAGFGDGGGGNPNTNARDLNSPFGSILRLTDEGDPAPGNAVDGGLPEMYAYGFRNPWRWSFDRKTGELWGGDVGYSDTEEVNRIVNGGDYGWSCLEGLEPYLDCPGAGPFVDPVLEYGRADGKSVTGGYVYRGEDMEELYGVYIFGDFGSGMIWGLWHEGKEEPVRRQLLAGAGSVVSFAQDNAGELYVVDRNGGTVSRIRRAEPDPTRRELPEKLSDTGCVNPDDPTQPADGLIPYDIKEAFWSDTAAKRRFIALPEHTKISVLDDGDFRLPVGTILVKKFYLDDRLIETRLLLHQNKAGWLGYSYEWNKAGTDARLLDGPRDVKIGDQVWHYPGTAECAQCHTTAAGQSLGLEVRQLDKALTYPSTGVTANQLDTFEALGLLARPLDGLRKPAMPASTDTSATLQQRVRSYMHSNCSHCHRPEGTSRSTMDLRFGTDPGLMNLCNAEPLQGDLGIAGARLMVPGDHKRSILWHRLSHNDNHRMPPLSTNVLDEESAELIRDWIGSLDGCPSIMGSLASNFTIRNRWTGDYLRHGDGRPDLGKPNRKVVEWRIVPDGEYYRIQSAANPDHFLHANRGNLGVGRTGDTWWSAQWEISRAGKYFRIRNRWKNDGYLHNQDGALELSKMKKHWHSAMWRFNEVD